MIFFCFNDTATTEIYTLSLHDALPISAVVVVAVFAFTFSWNEFLYALVLLQTKDKMTAPIGLTAYAVGDVTYWGQRSEEHTSELQSRQYLVCRLLLEKKKNSSPSTRIT